MNMSKAEEKKNQSPELAELEKSGEVILRAASREELFAQVDSLASEAGVSVATVSRALKDSPRISQEQRERIKAFAREHNFYPNA